jgi:hypothetical protein
MPRLRRLLPLLLLGSFLALATSLPAQPDRPVKGDNAEEPARIDPQTIPLGTSAAEVRRLLGAPKRISRQILDGRYLEQWNYEGPRSACLQFDWRKGEEKRLQRVQAPSAQPR